MIKYKYLGELPHPPLPFWYVNMQENDQFTVMYSSMKTLPSVEELRRTWKKKVFHK